MDKFTLRCQRCRNKVGESQRGITSFRHKGRMITVYTGVYPFHVQIVCENCKEETIFEICQQEVVEQEEKTYKA